MASARAVFSWIFSAAYCVSCLNWCSVRIFLARARISSMISLKTLSLLLVFASSISSLHAVNSVSFIFGSGLLFLGVCRMMFLRLIVCDVGIRIVNIEKVMDFCIDLRRLGLV